MSVTRSPRAHGVAVPTFREQILDNLADGVYFVDRRRRITYWNRGAERLTGFAAQDVVGHRCNDNLLCHVDADGVGLCEGRCPLVVAIGDGNVHEAEVWFRHRDGSRRPVRVRTSPLRDENGRVIGAVETFDDASLLVTARREAAESQRDALADELTGLPNRRFFNMMLAARIEDQDRYGTPFALLIADIDHFKRVNDAYGHQAGDAVLRTVGSTLKGAVRLGDFVARWGGEEFGVIAQHASLTEAARLAERLRVLVSSATAPVADGTTSVTISLGGAAAAAGEPAEALLGRADAALYAAKDRGRNCVVIDGQDDSR
jgi:diguanylate cyclase (GGDEF)-like protein/PAS domain S-box-containing protein